MTQSGKCVYETCTIHIPSLLMMIMIVMAMANETLYHFIRSNAWLIYADAWKPFTGVAHLLLTVSFSFFYANFSTKRSMFSFVHPHNFAYYSNTKQATTFILWLLLLAYGFRSCSSTRNGMLACLCVSFLLLFDFSFTSWFIFDINLLSIIRLNTCALNRSTHCVLSLYDIFVFNQRSIELFELFRFIFVRTFQHLI